MRRARTRHAHRSPGPVTHIASRPEGALVIALGLLLSSCKPAAAPSASDPAQELARVHGACVDAMLRSTCQVMTGPQASSSAEVVFVAGVGPVDAQAYRELRASGEAMCSVIQKACQADWSGAQCRTARSLWPAPARR